MLSKDDIASKVKEITSEQLGVDESQITPEAKFVDDLGADSLDTVELVMALEEEFDLEISRCSKAFRGSQCTRYASLGWACLVSRCSYLVSHPPPFLLRGGELFFLPYIAFIKFYVRSSENLVQVERDK
ncbi:unnamed protein product [marine sediment metagenome]|uniref:Carrier domain-containing protein n=1 Tax=marine sediment metagenome TaxID=412755 RepID=X1GA77_9ZZZZ